MELLHIPILYDSVATSWHGIFKSCGLCMLDIVTAFNVLIQTAVQAHVPAFWWSDIIFNLWKNEFNLKINWKETIKNTILILILFFLTYILFVGFFIIQSASTNIQS